MANICFTHFNQSSTCPSVPNRKVIEKQHSNSHKKSKTRKIKKNRLKNVHENAKSSTQPAPPMHYGKSVVYSTKVCVAVFSVDIPLDMQMTPNVMMCCVVECKRAPKKKSYCRCAGDQPSSEHTPQWNDIGRYLMLWDRVHDRAMTWYPSGVGSSSRRRSGPPPDTIAESYQWRIRVLTQHLLARRLSVYNIQLYWAVILIISIIFKHKEKKRLTIFKAIENGFFFCFLWIRFIFNLIDGLLVTLVQTLIPQYWLSTGLIYIIQQNFGELYRKRRVKFPFLLDEKST